MSEITPIQNEFLFYASEDGTISIQTLIADDTIWITQSAMEEVFNIDQSGISRHLKNIFENGELDEYSNMQKMHIATSAKPVKFYNLNVIISVGYRANSYTATQFRIWATGILKEYMLKGFAMDDGRLKQGKQLFGKDYFDELLERIRDIRASERRFYQKITDIYTQCSYDYDKSSPITQQFFAQAQNKLEYAVTKMTSAEIIDARANYKLPNMGLTTWKNQKNQGKVLKGDITIAKNYLIEEEISDLNRLVNMFLDFAENLAKKGKKMSMQDWIKRLDGFLEFNEYEILSNYGSIQKVTADENAEVQYLKFKPIQEANYLSDFDKAIQTIKATGGLPKVESARLRKGISGFDKKLKQALEYSPKD